MGNPVPLTEVKVVDIETGEMLARGVKGLIKARGPQIMKGYYKVRQPNLVKVFLKIDGCGLLFAAQPSRTKGFMYDLYT